MPRTYDHDGHDTRRDLSTHDPELQDLYDRERAIQQQQGRRP